MSTFVTSWALLHCIWSVVLMINRHTCAVSLSTRCYTSTNFGNQTDFKKRENLVEHPRRHMTTQIFQTLWWLHCNFSTLSLSTQVCFCNWLKALPLIVSICQCIVWMRSPITDLAWGQLDFSWFNWIYDMTQIQTSRDCFAVTASLLHIKNSFQNALWLWAWQMVKRDEIK